MAENSQNFDPEQLNLFDLHWDDILFEHVAIHLSIKDLLNFRRCSRTSLEFVYSYFKGMKKLDLSGHRRAHKVLKILEPHCKKLEVMNLADCVTIEDHHLFDIVASNPNLRIVNLSQCVKLSQMSVNNITSKCKDLDDLDLSKCDWFMCQAHEIVAVLKCIRIKYNSINWDSGIQLAKTLLFNEWDKLKVLSLAYVRRLSDMHLMQLSKKCRLLEHINLTACLDITDSGIEALANGCKKLQSMKVQHCVCITEYVLAPLRARGIMIGRSTTYVPPPQEVLQDEIGL